MLSEPRARARRKPPANYPGEFEIVWEQTGKRGHKFAALTAWEKSGKPTSLVVSPVWRSYLESLEDWRSPKDLSSWLNIGGHLQEWTPRKRSEPRKVDNRAAQATDRKVEEYRRAQERTAEPQQIAELLRGGNRG